MRINRFNLPDEDPFLYPVRQIVESSFKIITWLGIAATFQIAATATKSWYLWAVCGFSYLLILLYLQAFIDWIWKIRRDSSIPAGRASVHPFLRKAVAILKRSLGIIIWLALGVGMQTIVGNAIAAIIEFQNRFAH
jgi:hypothetical protein